MHLQSTAQRWRVQSIDHETDRDNQGASPRPQASEAVGHVSSGYSSPCADLKHGEPQCQSSLPCREVFLFLNQVRTLPHDAGVPGEVPEPAGYQHREICQRTQSSRRCMCSSESSRCASGSRIALSPNSRLESPPKKRRSPTERLSHNTSERNSCRASCKHP